VSSYPTTAEFRKHSENLQAVASALVQVERTHKRAIRENDQPSELAIRKVHTLLLGVYAEARLRKIIEDPTGFNGRERELIWLEKRQDKRWLSAVDFAARRHYGVMAHQSLDEVLSAAALNRVERVAAILRDDLAPVITDRNRIAHGQWVWQLKSRSENQFTVDQSNFDYNYVALRARLRLLDLIGRLVNVLCVSEPTFDRDFASLMRKIDDARNGLDGSTYPTFAAQLRSGRKPNPAAVASSQTTSSGAPATRKRQSFRSWLRTRR